MHQQGLLVAACVGEEQYVYSARRYDAQADCLDPYSPVETVPAERLRCRIRLPVPAASATPA